MSNPIQSFSEREFYLGEFRGRSIGIAWPAEESPQREPLAAVIAELVANDSRVVVLSPLDEVFRIAKVPAPAEVSDVQFAPTLWRALREGGCAGLRIGETGFADQCRRVALSLRLAKLVWVQSVPPVTRASSDERVSVVDLAHLEPLLAAPAEDGDERDRVHRATGNSAGLLSAIRGMIEGGIPSVNVCAPNDLARELFTYAGAGTFFTRDRYAEVRPLSIDDYDLANNLIERGEADGFLAPRKREERDAVLAYGVGVFIEGRYLAGIGAILPHPSANAAELACLFALTRYVGEGAGGQIVQYAIDQAREAGLEYLFSCTTSERVERFFERHGFRCVDPDRVPEGKWTGYDPERRARVRCLRFDLSN